MNKFQPYLLLLLAFSLTSCEAIGDIFGAGVYTGVILVVLGVGLLIWLGSRLFGRK